jgi:hypothetical protein
MTQAITQRVVEKSLYESDYLLWTEDMVAKLKVKNFDQVDIENLIEEIESLGRSEKREIKSRLKILLEHLLKRIYINMPDCFNGWENTIEEQREEIIEELMDSPSLKRFWDELFDLSWQGALRKVRKEYQPKGFKFPDQWQFSRDINSILNINFWE